MNNAPPSANEARATSSRLFEAGRSARLSGWPSYLLAIAITGATLMVRLGLGDALDTDPALVIFTIPIMLSAYFGGLGPGLLSTALSFLGASYFVLEPAHSFQAASTADRWHQALIVIAGVVISLLNEALHRAQRRADAATVRMELAMAAHQREQREQRELARLLRINEGRLVAAQAVGKVGSWETDMATLTTTWSAETHRIFGTDAATFPPTHESFLLRVHPDDRLALEQAFSRSLLAPGEHCIEHRVLMADARTRIVKECWQCSFDDTGRALKVVGTCQDITESKEADATRSRLAAVLESTTDLVIVWNADGKITYLNPAGRSLLGVGGDEEVEGSTLATYLPDAKRHPSLIDGMPAALRDGTWRGIVELVRRDGRHFSVSQVIVAQKGADGRIESYSSVMRDITARQQAEQALRLRSQMLDSVGLAIIATDPAGIITYANRFAGELYGWPIAAVLGRNIRDVIVPEISCEQAEQFMEHIRGGKRWSGEFNVSRSDGTRFPALVTKTVLRDAQGEVCGLIGISKDISDRKEEERRLADLSQTTARRERLLSTTLSSMMDFAYAYDREGRFLFVNQRLLDLWGMRVEDALGKNFVEIGYPADLAAKLKAEVDHVFNTAEEITSETEYTNYAGLTGYYEYIFSPALADDGSVDFVVGTTRDITERMRVANQVAASHKHLRDLIDGLGPAIFVALLTPEGVLIEVNRAPLDAAGLEPEDVLGKPFVDTRWWRGSPEAQVQLRSAIARAALGEPSRYDVRMQGGGDQVIDTDFSLQPMRDADGRVVFLISSATVITERKRAEEALQQNLELYRTLADETARINANLVVSEQRFRELAENVSEAFFIYSADRKTVHYISPAFEKIWGYPVELLYANPRQWFDAIVPADRAVLFAAVDSVGAPTPSLTAEFRIRRPDGAERWVLMEISEVRDKAGDLVRVVGTCRDITERKHSEEQLEKTHQQLLESSRKAGMAEVATNVLHNVGNVLNSVNVSASLAVENVRSSRAGRMTEVIAMMRRHEADLGQYITEDPVGQHIPAFLEDLAGEWSEQQQVLIVELESLRANIDHINHIVAMQQSHARISGTTEIVDLEGLVEDALQVQQGALDECHIRVVKEFENIAPVSIARHKVLPILVNLLRNAKDACSALPDSERHITLRIATEDDRVRISVADDGAGIAPENMTRIFSHGFTTRKDGHGFGLHSGALAAAELGGSLSVVSEGLGKGATFTLDLPLEPQEELA